MPIKTMRRLLNLSDPFDDYVEHTQRILAYCRTMRRDAKRHDFKDIKQKAGACKRIIGRQVNRNSQHLISLWRKQYNLIHHLHHTAGKTRLHAMHEVMKDWLEEVMISLNNLKHAAQEAEKLPKSAHKPDFTPLIEKGEKPAKKMLSRAHEIRRLYHRVKSHNPLTHPVQRRPQQRKPPIKKVA